MDTQVTHTNTTRAVCVVGHADLVKVLGLAVMMDAGIARDQPGTDVTVDLVPSDVEGEFDATVTVVVDHNFVPPAPASNGGPVAPSLNSDAGGPAIAPGAGTVTVPQIPVVPSS